MRFLFNLSFRYKVPLWGGLLIIVTALAILVSLINATYDELKDELLINSGTLGHLVATSLFPAILHDDIWGAFEIVNKAMNSISSEDASNTNAETILVVDNTLRVFVSAHPRTAPILTEMRKLSPEMAMLADRIAQIGGHATQEVALPNTHRFYFVTPIVSGNKHLGSLIFVYPKSVFLPHFTNIAWHTAIVGAIALAILLPLNWYWGQRMVRPLVQLTARMREIGRKWPSDLDPGLYAYRDELGHLFEAYNQMLHELKSKEALEAQMVRSERLAALGQLAAGIAHEINNPLSGMLTAIDTLKCHGDVDAHTLKTITLIERGLGQIKDTVGALLVEAKLKSRNLAPQDIEDVLTLITPMARKKALHIAWHNSLDEEISLPATFVRQILINLLINAVQAADQQGEISLDISFINNQLQFSVSNNGKMLSPEQIAHLFEPFSPLSEGGHGLGLWVTYQIVHQLGGHIIVERESNDHMRFTVSISPGVVA